VNRPDSDLVLDPAVVQSLKELGGEEEPELFAELVEMFLGDTPPRLASLVGAIQSADSQTLEKVAHALKSSCGNLGARRLAKLCQGIEAAGRAGDVGAASELVARTDEEFQRVELALRAQLG
jgi:HPt (histidine-containing phosphotransfer) domain-containing protein